VTDAPIPSTDRLLLDADALNAFFKEAFPHSGIGDRGPVIAAEPGLVRVEIRPDERALRPGALISGPTMMSLADTAAYALVLAHVGPVAMAVTNSLTIHFLRGCKPGPVFADARLLRLGRRIVTTDVRIWTEGAERLVAQATVAYTLP
jgi:uncharacterized protein (TIGR00369 family)